MLNVTSKSENEKFLITRNLWVYWNLSRHATWHQRSYQIALILYIYMASSVSGQDEPNHALWLATRAGKMEPSCPIGTTRCILQAKFHQKPYNKFFIDHVCSVKMAGYWPRSFFASLWTSTSSRSINTQKKNLANIQPSCSHTWSITHTKWLTWVHAW